MNDIDTFDQWLEVNEAAVFTRLLANYDIDSDNMEEALYLMFEEKIVSDSTDEEFDRITDFHHQFLTDLEAQDEPYMTNSEYWNMTV